MITRTFDAERVNFLVNHPDIRPFIGGDPEYEIDLSAAVEDRNNFFLDGEHGGQSACWSAPFVYEIHTFILPEGRGLWALKFARAARDYMEKQGARHLWTRVHPDAPHVRLFAVRNGFQPAGTHAIDQGIGPVTYDLYEWRPECPQHQ